MEQARTTAELTCRHRVGVICKREGIVGTHGNCEKCGWSPETEERRKQAYRERLVRKAPEEDRKQEAER